MNPAAPTSNEIAYAPLLPNQCSNFGRKAAHNNEPTACTQNTTPTQLPASWKAASFASAPSQPKQLAAIAPFEYVHIYMKAAQQKNCTRPTVINARVMKAAEPCSDL